MLITWDGHRWIMDKSEKSIPVIEKTFPDAVPKYVVLLPRKLRLLSVSRTLVYSSVEYFDSIAIVWSELSLKECLKTISSTPMLISCLMIIHKITIDCFLCREDHLSGLNTFWSIFLLIFQWLEESCQALYSRLFYNLMQKYI